MSVVISDCYLFLGFRDYRGSFLSFFKEVEANLSVEIIDFRIYISEHSVTWWADFYRNYCIHSVCQSERRFSCRCSGCRPIGPDDVVSSSTQFLFFSSSLLFSPCMIIRLVTSVCPFVWGWATDVNLSLMPNSEQKVLNLLLSNCFPLSVIKVWGMPNLQMTSF